MATVTCAIALAALTVVLVAPASSVAQTQVDFDACNQQAKATAASPSASPSTSPGAGGGSTMTSPGSPDANRQPNASGRMSGSAGSPGTGAGTTSGGTSGTTSGGSTAAGADVRLQGMATAGLTDEAYKQTYRDCMKRRGF
jgi:hypothetical protein